MKKSNSFVSAAINRLNFLFVGTLGNLASSLWFIPFAANLLHKIRGMRMQHPFSTYFASHVAIDNRYPRNIHISPGCVFASYSIILAHSFVPKGNTVVGKEEIIKSTYIGRGVFVGANSVILPGTSLGDYCYVAAGSIVSGNFESNALIAGNPAVIKRVLQ